MSVTPGTDETLMAQVLRFAESACHYTCPNHLRDAVFVVADGVVCRREHSRDGLAAMWRSVLEGCQPGMAFITLYLPPAGVMSAVINARPKRLVVGDAVSDRSESLERAGVNLRSGLLQESIDRLNPGRSSQLRLGRPYTRCKLAMSLDGRTALANGVSQWITGPAARRDVQRLRARSAAIVTGVGTVSADDPQMTVRTGDALVDSAPRQRVVLDSHYRIPRTARMLKGPGTLVFGVDVPPPDLPGSVQLAADSQGRVTIESVLAELNSRGCGEVLFECGASLAGNVIESGCLDELVVYIAPKLLGPAARGLAQLTAWETLAEVPHLTVTDTRVLGEDIKLTLKMRDVNHGQRD